MTHEVQALPKKQESHGVISWGFLKSIPPRTPILLRVGVRLRVECLQDFLKTSIPTLMESLELPGEPLPLWWTADFINSDPGKPGTPCTIDKWIVPRRAEKRARVRTAAWANVGNRELRQASQCQELLVASCYLFL